jgi:hypothetical protein
MSHDEFLLAPGANKGSIKRQFYDRSYNVLVCKAPAARRIAQSSGHPPRS